MSLKLGFVLLSSGLVPLLQTATAHAAPPQTGVYCSTGTSSNPTFTLDTKEGYIQLPDGNTMYMWGYSQGGDTFMHPGPVLCVNQGDTVTVILNNTLPEAVSIMFPGQESVLANGAPAQPDLANNSLTNVAAAKVGTKVGTVTYSFVASNPGSYIYESGTNPAKQVRMGLFGALVVRPTMGAAFAYDRADSQFTPTEEFMVLLSDIDPYQHQAAESGATFNLNSYHPRYWLINGRGFPDSIADNFSPFLPDQPFGALARITPFGTAHPYPGRVQYLNVGTENYPFHPHGNNGLVIGRDGRPLEGPRSAPSVPGKDLSFEKFAINIGPGQTWDVLFKWNDAENYSLARTDAAAVVLLGSSTVQDAAVLATDVGKAVSGTGIAPGTTITQVTASTSFQMSAPATANGTGVVVGNAVPVTIPQVNNQEFGMFYSGSPYLGQSGPLPPGASTLNECGEYYIISHNHALFQITSWGVNMTGPITYVRVDPPLPNSCP